MKKDIFLKMKDHMVPDESVEAALIYKIENKKRQRGFCMVMRWVPACTSVFVGALLVFNMAMPSKAEQLPFVGGALQSLNESGEAAREKREKSQTKDSPITVCATRGECNGLDLKICFELRDNEEIITDKSESVTLSDCSVKLLDTVIYPTDEMPILSKTEEGTYVGLGCFNASVVADLLPRSGEITAQVDINGVNAFVEGATFEESVNEYSYKLSFSEDITVKTDLSGIEVKPLDIEKDGITIEYKIESENRTDYVYSVDESVDYSECFALYTDNSVPRVITKAAVKDDIGRSWYNATFIEYEEGEASEGESVPLKSVYLDGAEYLNISDESIIIYSHATGQLIVFEEGEGE